MGSPFTDGTFTLGQSEPVMKPNPGIIKNDILPFINGPEEWEQYHNEFLYEAEVALRAWIKEMSETNGKWVKYHNNRKYTYSMLFEIIYGRPYDQTVDAKCNRQLIALFSYYSSRIQNGYWDKEKKKQRSKTAYTISPSRLKRPPYSLKLRMEWFEEQGITMTSQNMALPKEDLRPGHARNPRTNANMEMRSEQMRERHREYQRNHKPKARSLE